MSRDLSVTETTFSSLHQRSSLCVASERKLERDIANLELQNQVSKLEELTAVQNVKILLLSSGACLLAL